MLISVVIPCYNSGKYLYRCLESIQNQTFLDFEVIIIDDGSTDESIEIAKAFVKVDKRFKLFLNERNCGVAFTRSRGIKEAKGDFIALMDSDDESLPNRFALQISTFSNYPEIDVIGGGCICYDADTHIEEKFFYPEVHNQICIALLTDMPFCNSSLMFRTSSLRLCHDLYIEKFAPAEDFELLVRLKLNYKKFANIKSVLVKRTIHRDSITFSKYENLKQARLEIIAMQLPQTIDKNILNHFFYHFHYGGKLITEELSKNLIKYSNQFLSLKRDRNLQNLYGRDLWINHVNYVYKNLANQTFTKLGFTRIVFCFLKNNFDRFQT